MLKRVVEHNNPYTISDRFTNAACAIWSGNDWDSLVQALVDDCLVAAVSTEHDCRCDTSLAKLSSEPRRDGRLSCTAAFYAQN